MHFIVSEVHKEGGLQNSGKIKQPHHQGTSYARKWGKFLDNVCAAYKSL